MPLVDKSMRSMFTGDMTKEEAPLVFLYVFLTTTALIMLVYFFSLIIFHCVFWPKILAKIKADKPKETAKQEQILQQMSVARDKPVEDKTQSERSDSPVVERTPPSDKECFRAAHTVVSENASLIGDKTPGSARSAITCAATVTAAPAASPQLGVQTAKENRKGKARKWYEDDMMTTGMELSQPAAPRKSQESKDHRKGKKRSEDMRTGREEKDYHLRTGREKREEKKKEGGRTIKRLRFASASPFNADDTRTCLEKLPLLSQSIEERKSDEAPLQQQPKKSQEGARTRRKVKDLPPASFYAYEVDPTQREGRGTERKRSRENVAGTATRTAQSTDNRSTDRPEKPQLLELCKTQED